VKEKKKDQHPKTGQSVRWFRGGRGLQNKEESGGGDRLSSTNRGFRGEQHGGVGRGLFQPQLETSENTPGRKEATIEEKHVLRGK